MSEMGLSRQEFVRLGALMGLIPAASALAACGSGGTPNGGGGPEETREPAGETVREEAAPETTSEPPDSGGGYIALESEVSPGTALDFQDGGEPAVLVRLNGGDFVAYSAVCTHQGCTVAYNGGGGTLECPCHGSAFDPSGGGTVSQGPAQRPLPEIPVEVQNGEVRRA